jgi:hypothetical protein
MISIKKTNENVDYTSRMKKMKERYDQNTTKNVTEFI